MLPSDLTKRMKRTFRLELGVPDRFSTATPILVVTGKNAAGKSFLRRWFCMMLKDEKIEAIHLSQQGRASEGFVRAFVYGDESDHSTGAISAHTFIAGMNTSKNRTTPHVLIWDEPEIGMGDELQIGTADWLFSQLVVWPQQLNGVILLTHSRYFVERAMMFPGAKFMNLDGHRTAKAWMERKIVPVSPTVLYDESFQKWRRLTGLINSSRKESV